MMDIREQLRPAYQELHGLYASMPNIKENNELIYESSFWEHYHEIIDEINSITGENYGRSRVNVINRSQGLDSVIYLITYKQKLAGLISRLYGKYFSTERHPLTSAPSTLTTINQFQSQAQNITIEFEKFLEEKIRLTDDENKKKFLTTLKEKIKNVSDTAQLIKNTAETARDLGIGIAKVIEWFS